MFRCRQCYKSFASNRGLALHRHNTHAKSLRNEPIADEDSDTGSETKEEGELTDVSKEEESETDAGDDSDDSDEENPWDNMLDEVRETMLPLYKAKVAQYKEDGNISEAKERSNKELLPIFQDQFKALYKDKVQLLEELKKDPIHKKIISTKKSLQDDEDFDEDEALSYAVEKRHFLLERMIPDNVFDEDTEMETDDDSDIEPPKKKMRR